MADAIELEVSVAPGVAGVDAGLLRERLAAALAHIGAPVGTVCVNVVGDQRMRDLNRTWKGRDETTDVLSFCRSAPGGPIEADIAVGAGVAAREAAERGHPVEHELLLYALHGVLHCAGYDDDTEPRAAAMHAEEDRILAAIGVGRVFTGAPRSAPDTGVG